VVIAVAAARRTSNSIILMRIVTPMFTLSLAADCIAQSDNLFGEVSDFVSMLRNSKTDSFVKKIAELHSEIRSTGIGG
jgi:hypothetical protein